jgi:hypothetical protein
MHQQWPSPASDPVECVRELIGNVAFRECMAYAPEKTYADKDGRNRQYDEMWAGDWWWETQAAPDKTTSGCDHIANHSRIR